MSDTRGPDRRQFLIGATAVIVAHCGLDGRPVPASDKPVGKEFRITALDLLTSAPLAKMRQFYRDTLGLKVLKDEADQLTIAAGGTLLTFRPATGDAGNPFYHFAFNIPENKAISAHDWQKERSPLLPIPERLRDPRFPGGVVHYRHWNAHSVFFLDPGGNVVEHIARHDLKNAAGGTFGPADILYASEIGLIVDDVPATAEKLKEATALERYKGSGDEFTALGDELGLVLVMKRGRVLSFDAPDKKSTSVYRTGVTLRGAKPARHTVPKFPYEVAVES